jgi:hypothetical protein
MSCDSLKLCVLLSLGNNFLFFKENKMAIKRQRKNAAYGVGQPLYNLSPQPISSTRVPTTSDFAEIGTIWTNKSTNVGYILTSIVANSATWSPLTVNAGATLDTGDLTLTVGDLILTAGNIDCGGSVLVAGSVEVDVDVECRSLFIDGDEGTGVGGMTMLTNVVDTTLSTGAGVVLMKTANPQNSSGWMKIYVGTDVRYIPYWTTLSP